MNALIRRLTLGVLLVAVQTLSGQDRGIGGTVSGFERIPTSDGSMPLEDRLYAAAQRERFLKNLDELERFSAEDWLIESDQVLNSDAREHLEEQAKNLERIANQIREFFQSAFNVSTPRIDSVPDEGLEQRVDRVTSKVDEVLPLVIKTVTRGAVLDVDEFPRMMRGLAEIEALAKASRAY